MSRLLLLLLLLPLSVLAQNTFAQTSPNLNPNPNLTLEDSQLDYYLLQAFQAKSAPQRIALNHIGIQVQPVDGAYLVTASLEDYPAQLAGIERGDKILSVNGAPFHPVHSFNAAADAEDFTPSPAEYELEVSRNGSSRMLRLTPVFENLYDSYRTATLNSIQKFPTGNKTIGYVRFWGLSRASDDLVSMEKIIQQLDDCDGLIIDLRNSFGYLSASHLDLLFPNRRRYFTTTGSANEHGKLGATGIGDDGDYYQKPIAVLLNSTTRGGAELFAYQLSKLERVVTLGEKTAGKIGEFIMQENAEGKQLRYLPAEGVLIDGKAFESLGVEPEQVIAYPFEQSTRSDPQYEAAVALLLGII